MLEFLQETGFYFPVFSCFSCINDKINLHWRFLYALINPLWNIGIIFHFHDGDCHRIRCRKALMKLEGKK